MVMVIVIVIKDLIFLITKNLITDDIITSIIIAIVNIHSTFSAILIHLSVVVH